MSLVEQLSGRRIELAEEAERLGKQLAEVQHELERVAIAEQVLAELTQEPTELTSPPTPHVTTVIPRRDQAGDVAKLPQAYRRMVQALADADTPQRCIDICRRLGLGAEPRHVEGARSKLKRLVERGWLRQDGAGMFMIKP